LLIKAMPAGDAGLLVETDMPPAWLADAVSRARFPAVIDVVPGARTVLVITEPGHAAGDDLAARIAALPVQEPASAAQPVIEIPVSYDGPDLEEVARLTGLSVADVIERHSGALYTVGWLGFSPGFGYLTGLDPRLAGVGRLESPRLAVPAGSVAIAAGLAAVYPSQSPGGWRLLGSTTTRMWDQDREPAALLAPGRHVRFVAVTRASDPQPPAAGAPPRAAGSRHLEVIRPGLLATVQDLGRPGLGAIGVPPSGAADPVSLIAANRVVGNPDGAAGLELTLGRAAFRCHGELTIAVTGAPATVTLTAPGSVFAAPGTEDTRQVPFGRRFAAPDGSAVSVGPPESGLRTYLAVTGGVAVPEVLGSRSADLLSSLGGGALRPGSTLPIGSDATGMAAGAEILATGTRVMARGGIAELRVIGGPRLDWFAAGALDALCADVYTVTPASNRTGLRLDGPPLQRCEDAELPSEGLVTGSLQVPHDGRPILLVADHPTVGGYPVIAVVMTSDIGLAAQLRPGDKIRFRSVPADRSKMPSTSS
jgi:KipI family sensor histidine kinase inhibitor